MDLQLFNNYGSQISVTCLPETVSQNIGNTEIVINNTFSSPNMTYFISGTTVTCFNTITSATSTIEIQWLNSAYTILQTINSTIIACQNAILLIPFDSTNVIPLTLFPSYLGFISITNFNNCSIITQADGSLYSYNLALQTFTAITLNASNVFNCTFLGNDGNNAYYSISNIVYILPSNTIQLYNITNNVGVNLNTTGLLEFMSNGSDTYILLQENLIYINSMNPTIYNIVQQDTLPVQSVAGISQFDNTFYIFGKYTTTNTGVYSLVGNQCTLALACDAQRSSIQSGNDVTISDATYVTQCYGSNIVLIHSTGVQLISWTVPSGLSHKINTTDAYSISDNTNVAYIMYFANNTVTKVTDTNSNTILGQFNNILGNSFNILTTAIAAPFSRYYIMTSGVINSFNTISSGYSGLVTCTNNTIFVTSEASNIFYYNESSQQYLAIQDTNNVQILNINWTYPYIAANLAAGLGCMVLLSTKPFNSSNNPTDTVAYIASNNLQQPGNMINNAYVVGTFYNDLTTNTMNVININPNIVTYYAAVYFCDSQGYTYYTTGVNSGTNKPRMIDNSIPGVLEIVRPIDPYDGQVYFDQPTLTMFMWNGQQWLALMYYCKTGTKLPTNQMYTGNLFYNTNTGILYIYDVSQWIPVQTFLNGIPLYDKEKYLSTYSNEPRLALINQCKQLLGYPMVNIELTNEQINQCIDLAIQVVRQSSEIAYDREYISIKTYPGQQTYYLNNLANSEYKIVDVLRIIRWDLFGLDNMDTYSSQLLIDNYIQPLSTFDCTGMWMWYSMAEQLDKIFVNEISYTWNEQSRLLKMFRSLKQNESALLECSLERTEESLITDRRVGLWLKLYTVATMKEMLYQVRGKYAQLPGANGGLTLNGDALLAQGIAEKEKLMLDLRNYKYSNLDNWGQTAIFTY